MPKSNYDYIVVGAGSAGAALATRLAQGGRQSVLLLEAGKDDRWIWTKIPAGVYYLIRAERSMWRFFTEAEKNMKGRRIFWPRGRNLGGSSTVNGMIWVHGDPLEFDKWRDSHGLPGWGASDLKPMFKKIETFTGQPSQSRGQIGPVTVTEFSAREPLMDDFVDACVSTGIPRNEDYNGNHYEGVGYLQFNTRRGWRQGTREAYLDEARSTSNLDIQAEAMVHRILFSGSRAVGVEYALNGTKIQVKANQEVILSAGAIQSPQLLELSGIGDARRLKELGIDVVHNLPNVGENLHDHLHTRINYRCSNVVTMNQIIRSPIRKAMMAARFALKGDGLMTCSGQIIHALAKSHPDVPQPDVKLQLHWMSSPDARDPKQLVLDRFPGVSIGTFALSPKSRGSVHIRSCDPMESPSMFANYLDHEDDRKTTVESIRMARRVADSPALKPYDLQEIRPGPKVTSEADLLDYVRSTAQTSYHPVGSCRMGGDSDSVVDARLRVRGVDGLRVADASVFPTMCSANTNAAAIVVGEKAAAMILEDAI